jgi:TANFOR domain-containing protein
MMKKIKNTLTLLLLWYSLANSLYAGEVNVMLTVSPPYTPYISDYFSLQSKTIVTITNTQRQDFRIKIVGKIEGDNGVSIYTSPNYQPPSPIIVPAYGSVTIYGYQLERYFDINTVTLSGIRKQELIAGGGLPEGNYTICIQAYDYDLPNTPRSDEAPMGCSAPFTIQQIEPPFTITPQCNENVRVLNPQNIVFTWTTPSKVSTNTKYLLKIAELPNNSRNAGDALQNITTPPFFEKVLTTNTYIYGLADPKMKEGYRYVYSITAFESVQGRTGPMLQQNTAYRNNGQSEPRVFTYGQELTKEVSEPSIAPHIKKTTESASIKFEPNRAYEYIPKSHIKGKIQFAFYKDEQDGIATVISSTVLGDITANVNNKGFTDPNLFSLQNTSQSSNAIHSNITADYNVTASMPTGHVSVNQIGINDIDKWTSDKPKKDPWAEMQKSLLEQAGNKRFPYSNQQIELKLMLKPELVEYFIKQKNINPFFEMPANAIIVGTTFTDMEGNFDLEFFPKDLSLDLYDAEVTLKNDKQFYLPPIPFPLVDDVNGSYDMGNILCLANTYRLKVSVRGAGGKELKDANISILRSEKFYTTKPVLIPEGDRLFQSDSKTPTPLITIDGSLGVDAVPTATIFEQVAKFKHGQTQKRLFEAYDNSELYYIKIDAEDHYPIVMPFGFLVGYDMKMSFFSINASIKDGLLEVSANYTLAAEKSKVVGRVVDKEKEVVLPNMTVTLFNKKDKSLVFTTKTDEKGEFILKNITPSANPYTLKVDGDIIKNYEDPEQLFIETDGIKIKKDPLYVKAQLYPVTGIVADLEGNAIPNAELRWKSGGKAFFTDEFGLYLGYNVGGKHKLLIKKPGFRTKEIEVELKMPESKTSNVNLTNLQSQGIQGLIGQYGNIAIQSQNGLNYSEVKVSDNNKTTNSLNLALQNFSKNNDLATNANILSLFEQNGQLDVPTLTLDTIKLQGFMVEVLVTDKVTTSAIANATINTSVDAIKSYSTNSDGIAYMSNASEGQNEIYVYSPKGNNYITKSISFTINPIDDTTQVFISLEKGNILMGTVSASGKPLENATIYIEGKDYIKTNSDAYGKYSLTVPLGEYTFIAGKTGLLADKKTMNIAGDVSQNFELKDPGFNASKLLGFDLILTESKPTGLPNEFEISGALVNIPSNEIFFLPASKKLEFFNVKVIKQGDYVSPKDGYLNLAMPSLNFTIWDYLKVKLSSGGNVQVKPLNGDITKGVIGGELALDIAATFPEMYGLKFPSGNYKLTLDNNVAFINAFYSQKSEGLPLSFKLSAPSVGWNIYGIDFVPDMSKINVTQKAITLAGTIKLNNIPGISNTTLTVNMLEVATSGDVKKVDISVIPLPKLSIGTFSMELSKVSINQYGLIVGGEAKIPIPSSSNAIFAFNNVNLNSSGINGGSYALKGNIDIFGVAKFEGIASNPLTFSKIPGTTHFRINGGGNIGLTKLIDDKIKIDNILIGTNGDFGLTCSPNFNVDFSDLATLKIKKIELYPTKKEFAIDGGFKLDIPGFGAEAGGFVHYKPNNVWVDKLNIGASMGGIGSFKAAVDFSESGFSGSGNIDIVDMVSMGMGFSYYGDAKGKIIKGKVNSGLTVPVGVVTFEQIGGGFLYNSIDKKYGVNLTGRMVLAPGTSAVIALNDINIGVEVEPKGPIFYGSATPNVLSMDVGKAQFKLDIPNKDFFVNTELKKKLQLLPGLDFDAAGGFMLAASARPNDSYWLTGVYTRLKMLGIIDEQMNITGAFGLNRAAHPEFNDYTLFIPEQYLNSGKINGINARFYSLKGRTKENQYCNDVLDIAHLCMYAYANMDINVYSNFFSNTYGMGISQEWGAGGQADFFGIGLAGADISVGYALNGGYGAGNWFINGSGNAKATAYVGCSPGGCGNGISWGCCFDSYIFGEVCPCPCGGRICLNPSVNVGYSSSNGKFDVDIDW